MVNPLDRAALYKRYQDAQIGRGLGSLFEEEGIGRGPLDYRNPQLMSDIAKINKAISETDSQYQKNMGLAEIQDLLQIGERRISDDLSPKGLDKALERMRRNQKDGFTDVIRDQQGNVIAGGNPLFKSPESLLSKKRREKLLKKDSDRITAMPPDSLALQMSGLDELADQLRPIPVSGPKSDESSIVKKEKDKSTKEFRAEEEKIASMTGGDPVIGETKTGDIQAALDNSFSEAMNDYINAVRGTGPEDKERTLDEYKAEFAEATGVDISGKVDKSSALMALGLALMQNRAGSGFNVGKMLSAVGAAGEKALPALEKAKEKAQSAAIAAGKYSDRAKDEAADLAGKKRGKYWVYRKGGKGTEFSKFDEGEFVDLNPFELNKLIENKDFASQYEFIDASDRMSILEKRAEGVDLGDMWSGYERYSLIGGKADDVPPELQVLAAAADPNYAGVTPTRFKIAEDPKAVARRFAEYQKMINSGSAKFENLLQKLNKGVTIPEQFLSSANEILVGFGIGETSDITEAKRLLKNLAIDEATNILKESGKTLSDTDRQLVKERVGQISWGSADVEEIKRQLEDIYQLTVLKPQENLDRAMSWLEVNAGIQFGSAADDMPSQAELDAMNEVYGTNYTLDDYK